MSKYKKRSYDFLYNKLDKMSNGFLINVDRSTKHVLKQARDIVLKKMQEDIKNDVL